MTQGETRFNELADEAFDNVRMYYTGTLTTENRAAVIAAVRPSYLPNGSNHSVYDTLRDAIELEVERMEREAYKIEGADDDDGRDTAPAFLL